MKKGKSIAVGNPLSSRVGNVNRVVMLLTAGNVANYENYHLVQVISTRHTL